MIVRAGSLLALLYALGFVLFAMTLIIVGAQWISQRRWVHYE